MINIPQDKSAQRIDKSHRYITIKYKMPMTKFQEPHRQYENQLHTQQTTSPYALEAQGILQNIEQKIF